MHSPQRLLWFRRLAAWGTVLAACVVVLGAWVRLTDAGLGCPDWPGCYGHLYPQNAHHFAKALHEMLHRYVATTLGFTITCLFIWALLNRKDRAQPLVPVGLLLAIVCVQGALGALTVTLLLKPLIVTAHLMGGLTILGLLWWLSLTPERQQLAPRERGLRKFALAGLLVLALQIALGGWTSSNYAAVACPDFPTCQHSWWPQMEYRDAFVLWRGLRLDYAGGVLAQPARVAIHFTHRLGAAVTGLTLIGLGVLVLLRARARRLALAGARLVIAVLLQISLGIATVHWAVPLSLATLHNAGAALLVLSLVSLLRVLYPGALQPGVRSAAAPEPTAQLGMVPFADVDASR